MTEDGWYLACPNCLSLTTEGWLEKRYYNVEVVLVGDEEQPCIHRYKGDHFRRGVQYLQHFCFNQEPFGIYGWSAEEFLVRVKDGKIVEVGNYWKYNIKTLAKLACKNNLKIVGISGDEIEEEVVENGT